METLKDSSKISDNLNDNSNQLTMEKIDNMGNSYQNGFAKMTMKGNKETEEGTKEIVPVKSDLEIRVLKATDSDFENNNDCDHLETNKSEDEEPIDNLPVCEDLAKLKTRLTNVAQKEEKIQNLAPHEEKRVGVNSVLERRRSSQVLLSLKWCHKLVFEIILLQDIFERIDSYRGGQGYVKLKDLVLFLRGVYDNIDDNFEVILSSPSSS